MNAPNSDTRNEARDIRAARALEPLTSSPYFAKAIKIGIQNEAAWRSVIEAELCAMGLPNKDQQRRKKERQESPAGLADRGRRPVVNWHEGGSGPALLLLNGWTASGLVWPVGWLQTLEKHFRVIRIDNRGTGWSRSAPAPYTMADLADDAADVLKACDIEDATVLGLSMGGMIAQELTLRHPKRVNRLILVSTAPPVPAQIVPDPAPFMAALAPKPAGKDIRQHIRELWIRNAALDFADGHPEVIEELTEQIVARVTPRQRVFEQTRAMRSWHGARRLRRINVPTTIIHGDRDPLMPVGNGMRLSRLIPGAEYIELEGVGHLPPHEAGDELLKVLGIKLKVAVGAAKSRRSNAPKRPAKPSTEGTA
jgi:pimeloyl-ACP methyl ester carboxylesterase